MRIRLVIISLADAAERRASAAAQLRSAGLPFEFFDAIRGSEALADRHFTACDEDRWVLHTGRDVTPNELGCFASHRAVWALAAKREEPLLVMEDDFHLREGFADAVRLLDSLVDELGFIRLQSETRARKRRLFERDGFTVSRYLKAPHSMMCYGLSPAVARVFVERTAEVCEPVDVFIKRYWDHGQILYGISPYTVEESPLSRRSHIGRRRKARKAPGVALRRLGTKLYWQLARLKFNGSA